MAFLKTFKFKQEDQINIRLVNKKNGEEILVSFKKRRGTNALIRLDDGKSKEDAIYEFFIDGELSGEKSNEKV